MSCDEMKELLALFAGSDVTDNERIAVEAHVGACGDCSRELSEHREIRGILAGMKEGEAPAGGIEAIWPRVAAEIAPAPSRRISPVDWLVRVAAVLVIGVALGYSAASIIPLRGAADAPAGIAEFSAGERAIAVDGRPGSGTAPFELRGGRPVLRLPRVDGGHHLPRVERILATDETDF